MNNTVLQGGDAIFQNVVNFLLQPLLTLAVVITFVYFLYGGLMFMIHLDDPTEREKGKRHLMWGLIGLFIIFSIGGILSLISDSIGGMF